MLSTSLSHSILGHWAAGRWVKPFEKPWWTTEVPVLWGVSAFVRGPRGKAGKSSGKYGELRWVYVLYDSKSNGSNGNVAGNCDSSSFFGDGSLDACITGYK